MISNLFFGDFITVISCFFTGKAKVSSMKMKENTIPPNTLSISFNLKSSIFFLLFTLFIISQNFIYLEAREPNLAILKNITSNDFQRFSIKNSSFVCEPYGVLTLEQIYKKSQENSVCRKNIKKFYIENRDLLYYSQSFLKLGQTYHIEFKNKKCIIYAQGQTTLSQLLLSNGLGVKKLRFKDQEFDALFQTSEYSAKIQNKGLWQSDIQRSCTAAIQRN